MEIRIRLLPPKGRSVEPAEDGGGGPAGLQEGTADGRAEGSNGKWRPNRIARQLALAYWIDRQLENGRLENDADAARMLRVSRARVSQLMARSRLPIAVQEQILQQSAHRVRVPTGRDKSGPRST